MPDRVVAHDPQRHDGDSANSDVNRQAPGARDANAAAGDAAVARMANQGKPSWNKQQTILIQKELRRLGFYTMGIDGIYGKGTEGGMVEAFGGDEWRGLAVEDIVTRLRGAQPPGGGKKGEHRMRYGELFKDGVLDLTLGIGFDEGGSHEDTLQGMTDVLQERGFNVDLGAAQRIYAQAGRPLAKGAFGQFYVKENALNYKAPAGQQRGVHAVVRLIENSDGTQGEAAAKAFKDGMKNSDVAYYAGHARYGSGPDFDRNMSFELRGEDGDWQTIMDYERLKEMLETEGAKKGRDAWSQFLFRVNGGTLKVHGENKGNVYVNPENKHANEFGAKLMYWNLNQKGGAGATPVTGKGGEMEQGDGTKNYKLWVFDGCRTADYTKAIRSTPGQDKRKTDMISTSRVTYWWDKARVLASFLDGIIGQQSAEGVIKGMDKENITGDVKGNAMVGDGFDDNPVQQ